MMKSMTELVEVVNDYCEGDKEKFEHIYNMTYSYLHTCAIYIVKNEDVVMDVLQETYMEIAKNIHQLNDKNKFLSWATMITKRKCYAYLKSGKDVLLAEQEEENDNYFDNIPDDKAFIPEDILQDREKRKLMREIINGLSDMQRVCIIGFYYNELKQEEIAEELGVPVNTVKTHLYRAKARIKEAVIELDEKKGTRLYSIAPFMLLFFDIEAEACTIPPMSEQIINSVSLASKSMKVNTIKSIANISLKTKIIIGASIVALVGLSVVGISSKNENETDNIIVEDNGLKESMYEVPEVETPEEEITESEVTLEKIEEIVEPEEEKITLEVTEKMSISTSEYESYGYAIGGVMPVKKNGLWGAINYNAEEIVPCQYTNFEAAPNYLGYFVLADMTTKERVVDFFGESVTLTEEYKKYYLFDKEGNIIYEGADSVSASGNYYAVIRRMDDAFYAGQIDYYTYAGELVLTTKNIEASLLETHGFYEGQATVYQGTLLSNDYNDVQLDMGTFFEDGIVNWKEGSGNIGLDSFNGQVVDTEIESEGNTHVAGNGTGDGTYMPRTPIGSFNNGYCVMYNPWLLAGRLELVDENNTIVSSANYYQLYEAEGKVNIDVNAYNEDNYCEYFYHDGDKFYNYGSKMVWRVGEKEVLVDLAAVPGMDADTMSEEIIVATYDYIQMGDTKYWLIQKGDKWGYIDQDGNEIKLYEDASAFGNGNALVIENGKAYLIDENFEIVKDMGEADSVAYTYDLFVITKDDTRTYYEVTK